MLPESCSSSEHLDQNCEVVALGICVVFNKCTCFLQHGHYSRDPLLNMLLNRHKNHKNIVSIFHVPKHATGFRLGIFKMGPRTIWDALET